MGVGSSGRRGSSLDLEGDERFAADYVVIIWCNASMGYDTLMVSHFDATVLGNNGTAKAGEVVFVLL